ncbi:hypothetical protein GPALN_014435 [Globodera pallida]|nr:hypothetical protein GPALN_014435 [Globodera pallida]
MVTHDAVIVKYICEQCNDNRPIYQTFEFSSHGSANRLGRYLRHTTKCERAVKMGLSYDDVHMVFWMCKPRVQSTILWITTAKTGHLNFITALSTKRDVT